MADTEQDSQQDIDFTIMYATHQAFRRDLRRLAAAVAAGRADAPEIHAGWANFTFQLHNHHTVEDSDLWPQVAAKVTARPDDQKLLAQMEAEHAELGPRIDAVDAGLKTGSPDLADQVRDLSEVIDDHFGHEENSALPLIQDVLAPADWRRFGLANASSLGFRGVARYIPWVLDGIPAADRRRFLGAFPPPVKVVNGLLWERRYGRRGLWQV
ncbi:MAG: hypothetical protein QOF98_3238 [Streptomyces sp.]|nr:hypothetical protein [Streptomyces sp.]